MNEVTHRLHARNGIVQMIDVQEASADSYYICVMELLQLLGLSPLTRPSQASAKRVAKLLDEKYEGMTVSRFVESYNPRTGNTKSVLRIAFNRHGETRTYIVNWEKNKVAKPVRYVADKAEGAVREFSGNVVDMQKWRRGAM